MLKIFKAIAKFIVDDIKADFQALHTIGQRIEKKQPIFREGFWKEIFDIKFYDFLKANWLIWLVIAFAFSSGIWVSANHYQDKCNAFILDTFYEQTATGTYIRALPFNQGRNLTESVVDFPEYDLVLPEP